MRDKRPPKSRTSRQSPCPFTKTSHSGGPAEKRSTQLQRSNLMPEAAIIDYGVGNLLSLKCALEKVGLNPTIGLSTRQIKKADAIALPGVGNFAAAAAQP